MSRQRIVKAEIVVDVDSGSIVSGTVRESASTVEPLAVSTVAVYQLSEREVQVLELMVAGLTFMEIASRLGIEERTVRTHSNSINNKLSIPSARVASTYALLSGIVKPERVVELWRSYQPHLLADWRTCGL
jgi:DNA-binding NarL/FixJ family response regulator